MTFSFVRVYDNDVLRKDNVCLTDCEISLQDEICLSKVIFFVYFFCSL